MFGVIYTPQRLPPLAGEILIYPGRIMVLAGKPMWCKNTGTVIQAGTADRLITAILFPFFCCFFQPHAFGLFQIAAGIFFFLQLQIGEGPVHKCFSI